MADLDIAPATVRRCPRCCESKPLTPQFFSYSKAVGRFSGYCKLCAASYRRERYRADPARYRQEAVDAYRRDPEKVRERSRQWGTENAERKSANQKRWYAALKAEMLAAYGGRCTCCDRSEFPEIFLTLEHVNRDGSAHRKRLGGQMQVYCELKRLGWPKGDYTLLCWNCQMASWIEGECPHARRRREAEASK